MPGEHPSVHQWTALNSEPLNAQRDGGWNGCHPVEAVEHHEADEAEPAEADEGEPAEVDAEEEEPADE